MKKVKCIFVGCLFIVMASAWCQNALASSPSERYYLKHPLMVEEVDKVWGVPAAIQKIEGDKEKRIYKIDNAYIAGLDYRYFIVSNGRVISSGLTDITDIKKKVEFGCTMNCPVSKISKSYYKKHPMTVEEVQKVWGQPVEIKKQKNGIEARAYKIDSPISSCLPFRYFIIKDSKVLASGITDIIDRPDSANQKGGACPSLKLSKLYYGRHPETIAEVKHVWGKPKAIQSYDNGMEIFVFGFDNSFNTNFKYRYFLTQDGNVIASGMSLSMNVDIGLN